MRKNTVATKIVSVVMSVVLAVGLVPLPAHADDRLVAGSIDSAQIDGALTTQATSVSYVERSWDGSKVVSETKSADANPVPDNGAMTSGWYVLDKSITKKGRINLEGDVNLILSDGCTLDVKGLYIPKGSTLTIYGQEGDTGKIYSHPGDGAAIGAYEDNKGGAIVIHGGQVEAEGGENAAGIGGNDDDRKDVGAITIYGGKVTAEGGEGGAGIGGGEACEGGNIAIYGGDVTATGGHYGAGIGGGNGQDTDPLRGAHGGTIKIYGGTVNATGGDDGAGIGGGEGGNAGSIQIDGGNVTAQGGDNSAGIGGGEGESTGIGGSVTINGGEVHATGGENAAGIGGGDESHCSAITVNGGTVEATGGRWGAGIGAGRDSDGGTIRITGGTVTATGKESSAGIGGGDARGSYADYSSITITGGSVTANGSAKGAGIGGGEYGHATVWITGGTVIATGGSEGGAGIGNGDDGKGSAIILGWSDATKESISINASSYGGLVRLNQAFKDNESGRFRKTASVADLTALAAHPPLTAWDVEETATSVEVNTWTDLQGAINEAEGARTIKLIASVSANGAECIQIPANENITIDLNGFTMNRGLTDCVDQGSVIRVEPNATLTVIDSSGGNSGTITGGASLNGGGICNHGTLYFKGGTISGNRAVHDEHGAGGGIFSSRLGDADPNAELYITGGVITNNTARNGGGVFVSDRSSAEIADASITANTASAQGGGIHSSSTSVKVKGSLKVTGNTGGNVYLSDGRLLTVAGALASGDSGASIGVTMANPTGNITSGLKDKGDSSNFSSDDGAYTLKTNGAGEAYLSKDADQIEVSSWSELQGAIGDEGNRDKVIRLAGDITAAGNEDRLLLDHKSVIVDLNGHALDRNRTESDSDGHVFELVNGSTLTIRDSVGGGTITGGYATNGGGINVGEGSMLIIAGGTITGNQAKNGGGIFVKGTLVMTGGAVTGNAASANGGGIDVAEDGRMDLTGADISNNTASDDGGGIKAQLAANATITRCTITNNSSGDYGAGIHLDARDRTLTITDSNIDHNTSGDDGAGIFLNNGTINMNGGSLSSNYSDNDGGGAKVTKSTTFTATGTTIDGNTARDEEGGGVKTVGTTTLSNCMISNNRAKEQGGGIFNDDADGSKGILTLENCTIIGNKSTDDDGGGVYSDHTLTLKGGEITGNYSVSRGGGIYIGDDSNDTYIQGRIIVKDNTASAESGSNIYLRTHKLVLTDALLEGSQIGITKENDNHMGVFTGDYSVYNHDDKPSLYFFSPEGLEVITGERGEASLDSSWSALRTDLANAANGTEMKLAHDYTASSRDDYLEIPEGKTITIDLAGFTLNRNRTSSDGDGHVIWVKKNAKLILKDSTATAPTETTAGKPGNGTITGGYSERGGGIYVDEGATCTIDGVQIENNKAGDDGAGLYVKGALSATNCSIAFNTASDCGGGIFSTEDGSVTLDRVDVTNNLAKGDDGGGLHLFLGADSSITRSNIAHNQAGDTGGGIYMSAEGKKLTITDTAIEANVSKDDGAGILLDNGTIEMSGGSVSRNESSADSGGVKVTSDTTFTADGTDISNNKASGEEGGGVKNYGTTTLTNCTINKNSAGKQGGGLYNDDGDGAGLLTLNNCEVTDNKAAEEGGGIYSEHKLTIIGGEKARITGNDATLQGDGIYINKDAEETKISGAINVSGNDANDLYLRKGEILTLDAAITGTSIGIIDMEKPGVFTSGYSTHHGGVDPSTFFGTAVGAIPVEWNTGNTEAQLVSYWPDLQAQINAAAQAGESVEGHVVKLYRSYTASSSDKSLKIDKQDVDVARNGEVTIDLNGFTLNRNLTSKEDNGNVIEVYEGAKLTIIDSAAEETPEEGEDRKIGMITGGYASKGGGIHVFEDAALDFQGGGITGNYATDNGGGIYNEGTLTMSDGYITYNSADDDGAGIYSTEDGSYSLTGVDIVANIAGDDGGGLYLESGGTLEGCSIGANSAANTGGGFRMDAKGKTLTITDTKIENNVSVDDGAGIYLHNGTINMNGGSLSKNGTANDSGGAKVTEKTTFNATGVTITGNRANTEEGGAIKNFGTVTLTDCTISESRAGKEGGGLYNDGEMTLTNCTVKDNEAQKCGGGIYSDEKLSIIGGTITGNRTEDFGGGVYLDDDSDDTGIQGNLVIQGNEAVNFGDDLYLCSGRKLAVTGALETSEGPAPAAQKIHVDLEKGAGVLTKGYQENNQTADPSKFFTVAVGYDLKVNNDGEVEICSDWAILKKRVESAASGATITLDKDYAATPSDGRIKIEDDKSITIDLAGYTLNRNRKDKDDDGHVLEVTDASTLTVMDSGKKQTGTIRGGWSKHGGGIFVGDDATLNLQGGTITKNRANNEGGGVYVKGTMNFTGGTVSANSARDEDEGSGGGIYLVEDAVLNLEGGTVTENDAAEQGGGIAMEDNTAKINVKGAPVVSKNHASESGSDIYLPDNAKLAIADKLADGAKLGVALEKHRGTVTVNYSEKNTGDPAAYFVSTEGYAIFAEGGEAVLGRVVYGESEYTSPFISANNQINTNTDTLSGQNWMSGISGERYLNEINTPRSHDSGMNNVDQKYNAKAQMGFTILSALTTAFGAIVAALGVLAAPFTFGVSAVAGLGVLAVDAAGVLAVNLAVPTDWTSKASMVADGRGAELAKTQVEYIDQQLDHGSRHLDIRLNNRKKVYKFIDSGVFNGWKWSDNGEDLWICHGKAGGGTYQAQDPDDEYLSFNQVLQWTMDFLEEHPTETVLLDLSPETEKKDEHRKIYERARTILEKTATQVNPSTGEPFLYKEPGSNDFFAKYTHAPKLADCRGKILIKAGGSEDFIDYVGGWDYPSTGITKTGIGTYTKTPQELVDELEDFGRQHADPIPLPTDAETHMDITWSWGLNSTAQSMGDVSYIFNADPPWENAEYVNPHVIGDGKLLGSDKTGQFMGIVSMDGFKAGYAEQVWRTNFFDGLQYRTVTVKSGLDNEKYPDQVFKVLKGTKIEIPGNIYKKLDETSGSGINFGGWQAQGNVYTQGDSFKVDEDVTFTAQWLTDGKVPVQVVWNDGNDADGLRPASVNVQVQNGSASTATTLTLKESEGWSGVVAASGEGGLSLTPTWNGVQISDENPLGVDTTGQYCYEVSSTTGAGYTLTFTHTPAKTELISGAIVWNGDGNVAGARPKSVTVRLREGTNTVNSATVTAADDWRYSFGEKPLYANGKKLSYSVTQDAITTDSSLGSYSTAIGDFTIVNTFTPAGQGADPGTNPGTDPGTVNDPLNETVQGYILWNDSGDAQGIRPASVVVTLKADGAEVETYKAQETILGIWLWQFSDLPETNAQGEPITYTVSAQKVAGYDVECEQIVNSASGDAPESGSSAQSENSNLFAIAYTLQVQKTAATVTALPEALELTYNGKEQSIIKGGKAEGGTMLYALGTDAKTQPAADKFSTSVPVATDAGTYYVWYYAKGDALHTDSAAVCLEVEVAKEAQEIEADDVEGAVGMFGKAIVATVTGASGKTEGVGAPSFEVTSGEDVVSVDPETGALELLAPGDATVKVTAAETPNYKEAAKDVTVSVAPIKRTVTFYEDAAGAKIWRTERLVDGTSMSGLAEYGTQEPKLAKEGYTLAGWVTEPGIVVNSYSDGDGNLNPALKGKLVDFSASITQDVDAYPLWIRDRLVVRLADGGSDASPVTMGAGADGKPQSMEFTVDVDEKIAMAGLSSAMRAGYSLDGWYTAGGVKWDGERGVTPEFCDKDASGNPAVQTNAERGFSYYTVTLTARWTPEKVGVSYIVGDDGTGGVSDSLTYGLGDTIALAGAPTPNAGKTFVGWAIGDSQAMYSPNSQFLFTDWDLVKDNKLTFTARYVDTPPVAVLFDAQGGTAVPPVAVTQDAEIQELPVTARAGYEFLGWYDGDTKVEFPYKPDKATTLTAHWRVKSYAITFDSAGGTAVASITQDYGSAIAAPEAPTKPHYTFIGWHPALPSTMPAENLTISAFWMPNTYQIKFDSAGGSEVATAGGVYGTTVEAPSAPTKEGFVFSGWLDASNNPVTFPLYMPDTNPTLTAKWKAAQAAPAVNAEAVGAHTVRVEDRALNVEYVIVPAGVQPGAKAWATTKRSTLDKEEILFEGLMPATAYDVWARAFETEEAAQSEAAMAQVTTLKMQQRAPGAPDAKAAGETAVAVEGASGALEYALVPKGESAPVGDAAWKSADAAGRVAWTGLASNAEYDVYARGKETALKYASPASTPTTVGLVKASPDPSREPSTRYTVMFVDDDNTVLQSIRVARGKIPVYTGVEPTKAATEQYTYAFAGWSPEIVPASGNAVYRATYTATKREAGGGGQEGGQSGDQPAKPTDGTEPGKDSAVTVTFKANGGVGDMPAQKLAAGRKARLAANAFERAGYSFRGWNTRPDGTGSAYADKARVTPSKDLTLYAQWVSKGFEEAVDKVLSAKGGDAKGALFAPLRLLSKKQGKASVRLSWKRAKGAKRYVVYGARCGKGGKGGAYKMLATVKASEKSFTVKRVVDAKGKKVRLKKGATYRFVLIADRGARPAVTSKAVFVSTAGGKSSANYAKVSVRKAVASKAKKLEAGKALKLRANPVLKKGAKVQVYKKLRYETTNKKVATVSKKGKLVGKRKGTCRVYAYAQNGVYKVVKVRVK